MTVIRGHTTVLPPHAHRRIIEPTSPPIVQLQSLAPSRQIRLCSFGNGCADDLTLAKTSFQAFKPKEER